jgi:hypothetical protein
MLEASKSICLAIIKRSPSSREVMSFIEDWEEAVDPIKIEVISEIALMLARTWLQCERLLKRTSLSALGRT